MGIEDYLRPAGPVDPEAILENSGMVICEPVPVPSQSPLTCRRGRGARTFQGQKAPFCDGTVTPKSIGSGKILACDKCKLIHATVLKDGVLCYGSVL